jgi:hypothetical protein
MKDLRTITAFYKEMHDQLLAAGKIPYPYAFKFNANKSRAGVCRFGPTPVIEVSKIYIESPNITMEDIKNTILHELAHAMTGPNVPAPHGPEWKAAALSIGCDAKRCSPPFFTNHLYVVACGAGCLARRHRKPTKFLRKSFCCKAHQKAMGVYRKVPGEENKYKRIHT